MSALEQVDKSQQRTFKLEYPSELPEINQRPVICPSQVQVDTRQSTRFFRVGKGTEQIQAAQGESLIIGINLHTNVQRFYTKH